MPMRLRFRGDRSLLPSLSSSLSEMRRVPVVDAGTVSWSGGMLNGPVGNSVARAEDAAIGGSR